jgi:hypothetical protein
LPFFEVIYLQYPVEVLKTEASLLYPALKAKDFPGIGKRWLRQAQAEAKIMHSPLLCVLFALSHVPTMRYLIPIMRCFYLSQSTISE